MLTAGHRQFYYTYSIETNMQSYFFIRCDGKYIKLDIRDILYLEALKNYVKVYTTSKTYLILISLRLIEKELPENLFCRVHRSFIAGITHISSFDHEAVYIGNKALPVSRGFKNSIATKVKILVCTTRTKEIIAGPQD